MSSAEPGNKGGLGVAALVLGTLINALHAISVASQLTTFVPKTLSKVDVSANDVFINWAGSICHTHRPKGGGDLGTGTAGISVDGCSCSLPVGTLVSFGRAWVFFIVLGEGLPIPGIDFFEDFPLLTLVVANLELANSFWVPLGGLRILLLITSCLDPMLCLILILLVEGYWWWTRWQGQLVDLIPVLYSKIFEKKGSKLQLHMVKCASKLGLTWCSEVAKLLINLSGWLLNS